tara:strand:- start:178 stop:324 length:147 start_codon:yes stop_codon:yes gene_type:complete
MRREKRKGRTFEYELRERHDERRNEPTRGGRSATRSRSPPPGARKTCV